MTAAGIYWTAEARKKLKEFLKTRHSIAHGKIAMGRQKKIKRQFAESCFELVEKIVECSDKKIVECLS